MTEMSRHLSSSLLVEEVIQPHGATEAAAKAQPVNPVNVPLQGLRDAVPGCHVAAFIDISSQMVLAVDARSKQPQERLDTLAERAVELLGASEAVFSEELPASTGPVQPDYALALSPANLEIYLRSAVQPDEALGLVCGLGSDFENALIHGEAALRAIGGGLAGDAA